MNSLQLDTDRRFALLMVCVSVAIFLAIWRAERNDHR